VHTADEGPARHPSLDRILPGLADPELLARLTSGLTAADLTSLLMAVMAGRAARAEPPSALDRYERDRFARPGRAPFLHLRRVEDAFIRAVPDEWDWVTPSPLVPFGTHAALGDLSQNWVVTTIRSSEVAADPTVALALEAASRRRDTTTRRSAPSQRLAALQRITRAQRYSPEEALVHFTLFALVTGGRSEPAEGFDAPAMLGHLAIYLAALRNASAYDIEVALSTSADRGGAAFRDQIVRGLTAAEVSVIDDPDRLAGQPYYTRACFKVHANLRGMRAEIADGGFTDWTERLLADRKERLMISGAGLDRLATISSTE
jgi:hypothetical protein